MKIQGLRNLKLLAWLALLWVLVGRSGAQVFVPDERFKTDILLVVAHPDDETLVSSYLARAAIDEHKRIAVVYCTRGDSGANAAGREHARALGLVREIEGRRALSSLGITSVWLLDGRDTAGQNVLVSLAAWPSGSVLEQLVRVFRLTRPDIVFTWLPANVAGENHGDHQAAGVLATQAFDVAGDPTVYAWQLAAPIREYENALEGLRPWQAKKLYYFSDAFDTGFFHGRGPEYSGHEISPTRRVSYRQLAIQSAAPYYTQSPDPNLNRQIEAGRDIESIITKFEQAGYFPDPVRLWLGKSLVASAVAGDVFEGVRAGPIPFTPPACLEPQAVSELEISLGGPWGFYRDFWRSHELKALRFLRPEIAVRPSDTLTIPLVIRNNQSQPTKVTILVSLPDTWRQKTPTLQVTVPGDGEVTASLPVIAPDKENRNFSEIRIATVSGDSYLFQGSLFASVHAYVFEQLKW